jgi:hypothetical protein
LRLFFVGTNVELRGRIDFLVLSNRTLNEQVSWLQTRLELSELANRRLYILLEREV